MHNFKVMMAYDGSRYHGFQRQENSLAIQQIIEEAIEKIINKKTVIYGCSRTDTGVHANEFCFNFHHDNSITCHGLVCALNSHLPEDMAVTSCEEVDDSFHARYSCKGKEYVYKILNRKIRDPFLNNMVLRYDYYLDEKVLDEVASMFIGMHDFKSFCSAGSSCTSTVRTIYDARVTRDGDMVYFTVSGDGFLYNMVRIMVGTLLFVNEGKFDKEDIKDILIQKNRYKAGKTAIAAGLYLNRVYY